MTAADTKDDLYVGITRPTMKWGVTYEAILFCGCSVGMVFIGSHNLFTLGLYFPLHGLCYLICLKDPAFFKILKLWIDTKCKSNSWRFWGAATNSPLSNVRQKKRVPLCRV